MSQASATLLGVNSTTRTRAPLRLKASDGDDFQRCPRYYKLKADGTRGTDLPKRAFERYTLLAAAIAAAHREGDAADFAQLRARLERAEREARPPFAPECAEERDELLRLAENYAALAAELGGRFLDRPEPFFERTSKRGLIELVGRYDLLFEHATSSDPTGGVIEIRRISTSRYLDAASESELAEEWVTHFAWLLVSQAYPTRPIRLCQVILHKQTYSVIDLGPAFEERARAAIGGLAASMARDEVKAPKPNHLCGTCPYLAGCGAIQATPAEDLW